MTQDTQGRLSPFLRERRIRAVLPYLRGRCLDFGCGSGALADHLPSGRYHGVDVDRDALAEARRLHPRHTFTSTPEGTFDTVAALAVLEHLSDPAGWMGQMRRLLRPGGWIVVTTPHPIFEALHAIGAKVGLLSREAHDEHEELLDRDALAQLGDLTVYRRFLCGGNQLAVFI